MSEKLNEDIRQFFIKIGNDIKNWFDECCPCSCLSRNSRVHARMVADIENQVSKDMRRNTNNDSPTNSQVVIDVDIDSDENDDTFASDFTLNENVIVKKRVHPTTFPIEYKTKSKNNSSSSVTGDDNSDDNSDDFIIIY
tara:strand:+ start:508 stop:924 length:417 start_codon:yes stop_codon:yes gene_type:complete